MITGAALIVVMKMVGMIKVMVGMMVKIAEMMNMTKM